MSPLWLTLTSLLSILLGAGGVLAWVKFFRSEAHVADAGIVDTIASAKLKEAQATEVIAEAFTNTLSSVRQLAEDRAKENTALRIDLSEAQKEIVGLKTDVDGLRRQLDERELDRLILRQRFAEGLALARIAHAFLDAVNRRAKR